MVKSSPQLVNEGSSSFLRAARAGNLEKVVEYLNGSLDINTANMNGMNALHLASKEGHTEMVKELLKRGANVNAGTNKGNTALHIASLGGKLQVVEILVEHGANVNAQSLNGFTPLYMAAQENHDAVVRYLLSHGANQSLATEDGFSPLAVALQQGHDKVVSILLENDGKGKVRLPALHIAAKKDDCKAAALLLQSDQKPDVTSKSGFTPLHIAAHYGNESIATLLLDKGANINFTAKHKITPLHVAAKWGKGNMVALLLERGALIEAATRDGLTPLHCAARSGHEPVVDLLLSRGAPYSAKTKNGLAPLHMAAQGDHIDSARTLLAYKAPVDDVTVDYLTPLHVAAHCGHVKVAKLLLDQKADVNAQALNGFVPLHIACKKNRLKVVELLLKHGASIEVKTESGLTPLHVASFMGCTNIVLYLIQHGANVNKSTIRGETPIHLAARAGQAEIIPILVRNGAQVDARAREDQTALHIAARLGDVDIVQLLLSRGASKDAATKDQYTALHIAAKEGKDDVADVLLEQGASLTATTKKGFTPLHLAAKYGQIKVAQLLLEKEAPVDAQGKNGVTPLHVAAHYDHVQVALLLLKKKASPHATAKNGYTPLHIAAKKKQMEIATTLLEYGAKANAESKAGFTPLHLAAQEGHTDMGELLISHKADVNAKSKLELTPLHLSAQSDRVAVAQVLLRNRANVNAQTKQGYTPLHVACHNGAINMIKLLIQAGANVDITTQHGYTPLHQAAQQGHTLVINLLLDSKASPNKTTNLGYTPLAIAQKCNYISVVETLKTVTEVTTTSIITTTTGEKYSYNNPETMQETFMTTDSEDEGGEGADNWAKVNLNYEKGDGAEYNKHDESFGFDVTHDESGSRAGDLSSHAPLIVDESISPSHIIMQESIINNFTPDNIDISRPPTSVGRLKWKTFLVSFMVDARGGAMRGCRHSGVRIIIPPRKASMPMRITCRYLKKEKLSHPPPLMEGEACASRILEVGPSGAKFLGPVIIEVPHFASMRGREREIIILRSDDGENWREHTLEASEEAVREILNESFQGDSDLNNLEPEFASDRITRILTTDFPQYFAIITRIRQEVNAMGPEGGMVNSSVVPQVQAIFPAGALTKKIKVGLQAQPIASELVAKMLGNRVAVSPIVTVEPRRRKFHKPITLTIPVPQAATRGMINSYTGDTPTLRLLCSITGSTKSGGTSKAQWEDVTGSTPLSFVNNCVSFTTTVSARFWLMDCRQVNEATKFATDIYREAIAVPFMSKFVVFAKRHDPAEAQMRIFCMTDDKEDKTLEHQEQFTETAKSRDVEVLEGKPQYLEFAGNLVPVTKSGEQLNLTFYAFRENRLPFLIRVRDSSLEPFGKIAFMKEPRKTRGEPPQVPICNLNIKLPETIVEEEPLNNHNDVQLIREPIQRSALDDHDIILNADPSIMQMGQDLAKDWIKIASHLDLNHSDTEKIKKQFPNQESEQATAMLYSINRKTPLFKSKDLCKALWDIGRKDLVTKYYPDHSRHLAEYGIKLNGKKLDETNSNEVIIKSSKGLPTEREVAFDDKDIMKDAESMEESEGESVERGINLPAQANNNKTASQEAKGQEDEERATAVKQYLQYLEDEDREDSEERAAFRGEKSTPNELYIIKEEIQVPTAVDAVLTNNTSTTTTTDGDKSSTSEPIHETHEAESRIKTEEQVEFTDEGGLMHSITQVMKTTIIQEIEDPIQSSVQHRLQQQHQPPSSQLQQQPLLAESGKPYESETWQSGEQDTSQVSVSSLPEDEKSEPTTATVSSATTTTTNASEEAAVSSSRIASVTGEQPGTKITVEQNGNSDKEEEYQLIAETILRQVYDEVFELIRTKKITIDAAEWFETEASGDVVHVIEQMTTCERSDETKDENDHEMSYSEKKDYFTKLSHDSKVKPVPSASHYCRSSSIEGISKSDSRRPSEGEIVETVGGFRERRAYFESTGRQSFSIDTANMDEARTAYSKTLAQRSTNGAAFPSSLGFKEEDEESNENKGNLTSFHHYGGNLGCEVSDVVDVGAIDGEHNTVNITKSQDQYLSKDELYQVLNQLEAEIELAQSDLDSAEQFGRDKEIKSNESVIILANADSATKGFAEKYYSKGDNDKRSDVNVSTTTCQQESHQLIVDDNRDGDLNCRSSSALGSNTRRLIVRSQQGVSVKDFPPNEVDVETGEIARLLVRPIARPSSKDTVDQVAESSEPTDSSVVYKVWKGLDPIERCPSPLRQQFSRTLRDIGPDDNDNDSGKLHSKPNFSNCNTAYNVQNVAQVNATLNQQMSLFDQPAYLNNWRSMKTILTNEGLDLIGQAIEIALIKIPSETGYPKYYYIARELIKSLIEVSLERVLFYSIEMVRVDCVESGLIDLYSPSIPGLSSVPIPYWLVYAKDESSAFPNTHILTKDTWFRLVDVRSVGTQTTFRSNQISRWVQTNVSYLNPAWTGYEPIQARFSSPGVESSSQSGMALDWVSKGSYGRFRRPSVSTFRDSIDDDSFPMSIDYRVASWAADRATQTTSDGDIFSEEYFDIDDGEFDSLKSEIDSASLEDEINDSDESELSASELQRYEDLIAANEAIETGLMALVAGELALLTAEIAAEAAEESDSSSAPPCILYKGNDIPWLDDDGWDSDEQRYICNGKPNSLSIHRSNSHSHGSDTSNDCLDNRFSDDNDDDVGERELREKSNSLNYNLLTKQLTKRALRSSTSKRSSSSEGSVASNGSQTYEHEFEEMPKYLETDLDAVEIKNGEISLLDSQYKSDMSDQIVQQETCPIDECTASSSRQSTDNTLDREMTIYQDPMSLASYDYHDDEDDLVNELEAILDSKVASDSFIRRFEDYHSPDSVSNLTSMDSPLEPTVSTHDYPENHAEIMDEPHSIENTNNEQISSSFSAYQAEPASEGEDDANDDAEIDSQSEYESFSEYLDGQADDFDTFAMEPELDLETEPQSTVSNVFQYPTSYIIAESPISYIGDQADETPPADEQDYSWMLSLYGSPKVQKMAIESAQVSEPSIFKSGETMNRSNSIIQSKSGIVQIENLGKESMVKSENDFAPKKGELARSIGSLVESDQVLVPLDEKQAQNLSEAFETAEKCPLVESPLPEQQRHDSTDSIVQRFDENNNPILPKDEKVPITAVNNLRTYNLVKVEADTTDVDKSIDMEDEIDATTDDQLNLHDIETELRQMISSPDDDDYDYDEIAATDQDQERDWQDQEDWHHKYDIAHAKHIDFESRTVDELPPSYSENMYLSKQSTEDTIDPDYDDYMNEIEMKNETSTYANRVLGAIKDKIASLLSRPVAVGIEEEEEVNDEFSDDSSSSTQFDANNNIIDNVDSMSGKSVSVQSAKASTINVSDEKTFLMKPSLVDALKTAHSPQTIECLMMEPEEVNKMASDKICKTDTASIKYELQDLHSKDEIGFEIEANMEFCSTFEDAAQSVSKLTEDQTITKVDEQMPEHDKIESTESIDRKIQSIISDTIVMPIDEPEIANKEDAVCSSSEGFATNELDNDPVATTDISEILDARRVLSSSDDVKQKTTTNEIERKDEEQKSIDSDKILKSIVTSDHEEANLEEPNSSDQLISDQKLSESYEAKLESNLPETISQPGSVSELNESQIDEATKTIYSKGQVKIADSIGIDTDSQNIESIEDTMARFDLNQDMPLASAAEAEITLSSFNEAYKCREIEIEAEQSRRHSLESQGSEVDDDNTYSNLTSDDTLSTERKDGSSDYGLAEGLGPSGSEYDTAVTDQSSSSYRTAVPYSSDDDNNSFANIQPSSSLESINSIESDKSVIFTELVLPLIEMRYQSVAESNDQVTLSDSEERVDELSTIKVLEDSLRDESGDFNQTRPNDDENQMEDFDDDIKIDYDECMDRPDDEITEAAHIMAEANRLKVRLLDILNRPSVSPQLKFRDDDEEFGNDSISSDEDQNSSAKSMSDDSDENEWVVVSQPFVGSDVQEGIEEKLNDDTDNNKEIPASSGLSEVESSDTNNVQNELNPSTYRDVEPMMKYHDNDSIDHSLTPFNTQDQETTELIDIIDTSVDRLALEAESPNIHETSINVEEGLVQLSSQFNEHDEIAETDIDVDDSKKSRLTADISESIAAQNKSDDVLHQKLATIQPNNQESVELDTKMAIDAIKSSSTLMPSNKAKIETEEEDAACDSFRERFETNSPDNDIVGTAHISEILDAQRVLSSSVDVKQKTTTSEIDGKNEQEQKSIDSDILREIEKSIVESDDQKSNAGYLIDASNQSEQLKSELLQLTESFATKPDSVSELRDSHVDDEQTKAIVSKGQDDMQSGIIDVNNEATDSTQSIEMERQNDEKVLKNDTKQVETPDKSLHSVDDDQNIIKQNTSIDSISTQDSIKSIELEPETIRSCELTEKTMSSNDHETDHEKEEVELSLVREDSSNKELKKTEKNDKTSIANEIQNSVDVNNEDVNIQGSEILGSDDRSHQLYKEEDKFEKSQSPQLENIIKIDEADSSTEKIENAIKGERADTLALFIETKSVQADEIDESRTIADTLNIPTESIEKIEQESVDAEANMNSDLNEIDEEESKGSELDVEKLAESKLSDDFDSPISVKASSKEELEMKLKTDDIFGETKPGKRGSDQTGIDKTPEFKSDSTKKQPDSVPSKDERDQINGKGAEPKQKDQGKLETSEVIDEKKDKLTSNLSGSDSPVSGAISNEKDEVNPKSAEPSGDKNSSKPELVEDDKTPEIKSDSFDSVSSKDERGQLVGKDNQSIQSDQVALITSEIVDENEDKLISSKGDAVDAKPEDGKKESADKSSEKSVKSESSTTNENGVKKKLKIAKKSSPIKSKETIIISSSQEHQSDSSESKSAAIINDNDENAKRDIVAVVQVEQNDDNERLKRESSSVDDEQVSETLDSALESKDDSEKSNETFSLKNKKRIETEDAETSKNVTMDTDSEASQKTENSMKTSVITVTTSIYEPQNSIHSEFNLSNYITSEINSSDKSIDSNEMDAVKLSTNAEFESSVCIDIDQPFEKINFNLGTDQSTIDIKTDLSLDENKHESNLEKSSKTSGSKGSEDKSNSNLSNALAEQMTSTDSSIDDSDSLEATTKPLDESKVPKKPARSKKVVKPKIDIDQATKTSEDELLSPILDADHEAEIIEKQFREIEEKKVEMDSLKDEISQVERSQLIDENKIVDDVETLSLQFNDSKLMQLKTDKETGSGSIELRIDQVDQLRKAMSPDEENVDDPNVAEVTKLQDKSSSFESFADKTNVSEETEKNGETVANEVEKLVECESHLESETIANDDSDDKELVEVYDVDDVQDEIHIKSVDEKASDEIHGLQDHNKCQPESIPVDTSDERSRVNGNSENSDLISEVKSAMKDSQSDEFEKSPKMASKVENIDEKTNFNIGIEPLSAATVETDPSSKAKTIDSNDSQSQSMNIEVLDVAVQKHVEGKLKSHKTNQESILTLDPMVSDEVVKSQPSLDTLDRKTIDKSLTSENNLIDTCQLSMCLVESYVKSSPLEQATEASTGLTLGSFESSHLDQIKVYENMLIPRVTIEAQPLVHTHDNIDSQPEETVISDDQASIAEQIESETISDEISTELALETCHSLDRIESENIVSDEMHDKDSTREENLANQVVEPQLNNELYQDAIVKLCDKQLTGDPIFDVKDQSKLIENEASHGNAQESGSTEKLIVTKSNTDSAKLSRQDCKLDEPSVNIIDVKKCPEQIETVQDNRNDIRTDESPNQELSNDSLKLSAKFKLALDETVEPEAKKTMFKGDQNSEKFNKLENNKVNESKLIKEAENIPIESVEKIKRQKSADKQANSESELNDIDKKLSKGSNFVVEKPADSDSPVSVKASSKEEVEMKLKNDDIFGDKKPSKSESDQTGIDKTPEIKSDSPERQPEKVSPNESIQNDKLITSEIVDGNEDKLNSSKGDAVDAKPEDGKKESADKSSEKSVKSESSTTNENGVKKKLKIAKKSSPIKSKETIIISSSQEHQSDSSESKSAAIINDNDENAKRDIVAVVQVEQNDDNERLKRESSSVDDEQVSETLDSALESKDDSEKSNETFSLKNKKRIETEDAETSKNVTMDTDSEASQKTENSMKTSVITVTTSIYEPQNPIHSEFNLSNYITSEINSSNSEASEKTENSIKTVMSKRRSDQTGIDKTPEIKSDSTKRQPDIVPPKDERDQINGKDAEPKQKDQGKLETSEIIDEKKDKLTSKGTDKSPSTIKFDDSIQSDKVEPLHSKTSGPIKSDSVKDELTISEIQSDSSNRQSAKGSFSHKKDVLDGDNNDLIQNDEVKFRTCEIDEKKEDKLKSSKETEKLSANEADKRDESDAIPKEKVLARKSSEKQIKSKSPTADSPSSNKITSNEKDEVKPESDDPLGGKKASEREQDLVAVDKTPEIKSDSTKRQPEKVSSGDDRGQLNGNDTESKQKDQVKLESSEITYEKDKLISSKGDVEKESADKSSEKSVKSKSPTSDENGVKKKPKIVKKLSPIKSKEAKTISSSQENQSDSSESKSKMNANELKSNDSQNSKSTNINGENGAQDHISPTKIEPNDGKVQLKKRSSIDDLNQRKTSKSEFDTVVRVQLEIPFIGGALTWKIPVSVPCETRRKSSFVKKDIDTDSESSVTIKRKVTQPSIINDDVNATLSVQTKSKSPKHETESFTEATIIAKSGRESNSPLKSEPLVESTVTVSADKIDEKAQNMCQPLERSEKMIDKTESNQVLSDDQRKSVSPTKADDKKIKVKRKSPTIKAVKDSDDQNKGKKMDKNLKSNKINAPQTVKSFAETEKGHSVDQFSETQRTDHSKRSNQFSKQTPSVKSPVTEASTKTIDLFNQSTRSRNDLIPPMSPNRRERSTTRPTRRSLSRSRDKPNIPITDKSYNQMKDWTLSPAKPDYSSISSSDYSRKSNESLRLFTESRKYEDRLSRFDSYNLNLSSSRSSIHSFRRSYESLNDIYNRTIDNVEDNYLRSKLSRKTIVPKASQFVSSPHRWTDDWTNETNPRSNYSASRKFNDYQSLIDHNRLIRLLDYSSHRRSGFSQRNSSSPRHNNFKKVHINSDYNISTDYTSVFQNIRDRINQLKSDSRKRLRQIESDYIYHSCPDISSLLNSSHQSRSRSVQSAIASRTDAITTRTNTRRMRTYSPEKTISQSVEVDGFRYRSRPMISESVSQMRKTTSSFNINEPIERSVKSNCYTEFSLRSDKYAADDKLSYNYNAKYTSIQDLNYYSRLRSDSMKQSNKSKIYTDSLGPWINSSNNSSIIPSNCYNLYSNYYHRPSRLTSKSVDNQATVRRRESSSPPTIGLSGFNYSIRCNKFNDYDYNSTWNLTYGNEDVRSRQSSFKLSSSLATSNEKSSYSSVKYHDLNDKFNSIDNLSVYRSFIDLTDTSSNHLSSDLERKLVRVRSNWARTQSTIKAANHDVLLPLKSLITINNNQSQSRKRFISRK